MLDHPSEQQGGELDQTGQSQHTQQAPVAPVAGSQLPTLPVVHFNPPDWADDTWITNPNIQRGYHG